MSGWSVPPGSAVPVDLHVAWSVPPGGVVPLVLGPDDIRPSGWDHSAFGTAALTTQNGVGVSGIAPGSVGTPVVYNYDQYAVPSGIASAVLFGVAVVYNYDQYAVPSSIAAGSFGTAVVFNSQQFVVPTGIAAGSFGTASIFDPLQTITGAGGIAIGAFPSPHVADYYQYVDLTAQGVPPGSVGSAFVAFRVRTIDPPFIYTNAFGLPDVQEVVYTPTSWRSSIVSTGASVTHRIRELVQLTSVPGYAFGVPDVRNLTQVVRQKGWLSLSIPAPLVYNLIQHIVQDPYYTNSPPNFLGTAGVANRNREIGVAGIYGLRFGSTYELKVRNGARAIAPLGLDSLTWGPDTFISHRIRTVYPESWESLRMRRWAVVYNNAFLVEPSGIAPTSAVGRPDPVLNLNRTVVHYNVGDFTEFGTAFVAPRIRTVYPRNIPAPYVPLPQVFFNPLVVAPAGIEPPPLGELSFYQFQRIARPKSFNVHQQQWVGQPLVQNRNRVVAPQPVVRGDYGRPTVFNRNQLISVESVNSLRVGAHVVADRTGRIAIGGISSFRMPATHWIRNEIADPPGAQQVFPPSMTKGIAPHYALVPSPTVWGGISPDGIDSAEYGTASVRTNVIAPEGFTRLDIFGTLSTNTPQFVYPDSLVGGAIGGHQFSPYTIYAPLGDQATAQARANHPDLSPWHRMDERTEDGRWSHGDGWPWFGKPDVSSSIREVAPGVLNSAYPKWGDTAVELRRRYVYPTPIRGPRFGPVVLLNTPQYIGFSEDLPGYSDVGEVGAHVVTRPPAYPPVIEAVGLEPGEFGDTQVDLFNREIAPTGIPHRGNPQQGFTNPWGTPVVGYPREYTLSVGDATLWGTHRVEYLNREVVPEGWDSLSLIDEYLPDFDDRMRVTLRNPPTPVPAIPPASNVGTPTVSFRIRTVEVMPIRPPYWSMPRIGMTITPTGWEDSVFGDIDEWEAGKIKPHGDDMLSFPSPRLARGVTLSIGDTSSFGATRLAWVVYVYGMPPVGFDGPTVTDEFGCSRRVVTVHPIQAPTFPSPVVTT